MLQKPNDRKKNSDKSLNTTKKIVKQEITNKTHITRRLTIQNLVNTNQQTNLSQIIKPYLKTKQDYYRGQNTLVVTF
jgi:hypothetical protein